MLTKYGTDNIIVMIAMGLLLILIGIFVHKPIVTAILCTIGGLLIVFTLWFFRDPDREIPEIAKENEKIVLSPADGKIVEIVEEKEPTYLNDSSKRISIFLSPLDVHVNRIPFAGIVDYFKYHPGDYLVAYHPKSSIENEQTHIGIKNNSGKIFFKQIVGILARRLVWDIKVGDTVTIGKRFGMMKFGSRMDIAISPNSSIKVKVGDKVIAGETILAELP